VRGTAALASRLTFQTGGGDLALEVELTDDRLVGQVLLGTIERVIVEPADGVPTELTVDELGRFVQAAAHPGPTRLRLIGGGRLVLTDWFVV
jgi:hypothetical protein